MKNEWLPQHDSQRLAVSGTMHGRRIQLQRRQAKTIGRAERSKTKKGTSKNYRSSA
jgi:hypothetical protein